jgi:hypothetical protein
MLLAASAALVESIELEDARVAEAVEDARLRAIEDAASAEAAMDSARESARDSARGSARGTSSGINASAMSSANSSASANASAIAIASAMARANASRRVFASRPLELDACDADGTTALMAAAKTNLRQAPALVALLIGIVALLLPLHLLFARSAVAETCKSKKCSNARERWMNKLHAFSWHNREFDESLYQTFSLFCFPLRVVFLNTRVGRLARSPEPARRDGAADRGRTRSHGYCARAIGAGRE